MPDSGSSRLKAALISAAFSFILLLSACVTDPDRFGGSRRATIDWANQHLFVAVDLPGSQFSLLALVRGQGPIVTVYIEGDGAPWPTPFHPPSDPTPQQPVALAMANADQTPVIYMGRPCQYPDPLRSTNCPPQYWTTHRFAPEVLATYMGQLDALKSRFGIQRYRLVGYSGGGVMATLLASRRDDVEQLITVASPLALRAWTTHHQLSHLPASLDPADETHRQLPRAWHFVGMQDKIVPPAVIRDFVSHTGGHLEQVAKFDHVCCWSRDWPTLLEKAR